MIYLSGASNDPLRRVAKAWGIGLMLQPGNAYWGHVGDYPVIACDNGCFSQGSRFDLSAYLAWLESNRQSDVGEQEEGVPLRDGGCPPLTAPRCLFATAPDVWGDWVATWHRSEPVLPLIRALGYPAAVVAQDGIEPDALDWDAFDCLFIGGRDPWRNSAAAWRIARAARERGKWLHLGRVNSLRRLQVAREMGCQSADGTFIRFGPDQNLPRVRRWLEILRVQPSLGLEVSS